MDGETIAQPRQRRLALPGRGPGEMALLDFGPRDRPVDVVFLHANGFNARTYRSILGPLSPTLRIIAADQRGHGATTLPADPATRADWYDLRDDLLALLDALDVHDVTLAGHSMGGCASILATAADPARVRDLRLFDPVVVPRPTAAAAQMNHSPLVEGARRRRAVFPSRQAALDAYRGRGAFRTWPEETLADYVAGGFRDLPSGEVTLACDPSWEASNFVSHAHDTIGALLQLKRPLHILRAEEASTCRIDEILPDLEARSDFAMRTLPGTTHFLPMERPGEVRAALQESRRG